MSKCYELSHWYMLRCVPTGDFNTDTEDSSLLVCPSDYSVSKRSPCFMFLRGCIIGITTDSTSTPQRLLMLEY